MEESGFFIVEIPVVIRTFQIVFGLFLLVQSLGDTGETPLAKGLKVDTAKAYEALPICVYPANHASLAASDVPAVPVFPAIGIVPKSASLPVP